MTANPPNRETLKALYAAAGRFYALKPWDWIMDSDVFGVRNPADGEIGFCCIMGAAGEHFALAVYLGAEGLDILRKIGLREVPTDPFSVLSTQKCLMASFEDRDLLDKPDVETIRDLGLKYRGRNAWPMFRSYRPGYAPWTLTQPEAEFLTIALDQACDVCARYKDRPEELGKLNAINNYERFLVRVRTENHGVVEWKDSIESVPAYEPAILLPAPPDASELKRIAAKAKRDSFVMDMDYFHLPSPVKEEQDERPWYPIVVLCVDSEDGIILHFEMMRVKELSAGFGQALLNAAASSGTLPARVRLRSEQAQLLLEPVLDKLNIPFEIADSLPFIDMARMGLSDAM